MSVNQVNQVLSRFQSDRAKIFEQAQKIDIETLKAMSYDGAYTSKTNEIRQQVEEEVIRKVELETEIQEELRPIVERVVRVLGLLSCIKKKYREAVIMHKLEGLTHREIAENMLVCERTAQNYVLEGMKELKKKGLHNI